MRQPLSNDETSGTTRFQDEADAQSYAEQLGVADYDIPPDKVQFAEVSWTTAHGLQKASDVAFRLEANRRGFKLVKI